MYASAQDLQDRYPERDLAQLTDPNGAVVNTAKLSRALADASDEIDGYLQGRYTLPLSQVPKVLKVLACDIAMYRLQVLRPADDIEDARNRYKDAIAYLGKVAKGDVQLGLSAEDAPAPQSSGPEMITSARTFSRAAMGGF